jgi:two-component system, NarL family, nitrate/nitrite response regulator NarL
MDNGPMLANRNGDEDSDRAETLSTSNRHIRLVMADHHPLVLRGLDSLLSEEGDFTVVAQCADGEAALRAVCAHRPDILVLDVRVPRLDGISVLRAIKKEGLPSRVVILAASLDDDQLLEVTRLGVSGVVLKEMAPGLLVQCLRKVHAGELWLERRSIARLFETLLRREAGAREAGKALTAREIEIARLASLGLRNKTIGGRMSIGVGTVKTHLHHIYEKLHVESRAELILYCQEKGIT